MKLLELAMYLVYVATYIVAVPILLGFYLYRYFPGIFRTLLWGLIAVFILDVALHFSTSKNTFLYVFTVIDVLLFSWIFSKAVSGNHTRKRILIGGVFVVGLIGFDAFFYSGLDTNGLSHALARAYLVGVSVLYLSQLFQNTTVVNLAAQPLLWVGLGVLMYNAVGLFDAFSKPVLSHSQSLYLQFYIVWSIVTILMYGGFTYAFWMAKQGSEID